MAILCRRFPFSFVNGFFVLPSGLQRLQILLFSHISLASSSIPLTAFATDSFGLSSSTVPIVFAKVW
jgi:hypothetical protein